VLEDWPKAKVLFVAKAVASTLLRNTCRMVSLIFRVFHVTTVRGSHPAALLNRRRMAGGWDSLCPYRIGPIKVKV